MKKKILTAILSLIAACTLVNAREDRHIFHNAYTAIPDKAAVFKAGAEWLPYPEYSDRDGWAELFGDATPGVIKAAEKYLDYKFTAIPASMYLEYMKTKDRRLWEPERKNRSALSALALAELAEGKGRFIPKIIDGLFLYANAPCWSHPQHIHFCKTGNWFPDPEDRYISLLSASLGAQIATIWHYLHQEFDKYEPTISRVVLKSLDTNIFDPYLDESKREAQWWLSYPSKYTSGKSVYEVINNWDTECNTFVTIAFLMACQDEDTLLKALDQATWSVDRFMDYVKMDGACEEGPSYWNMANAKAYEFTKILNYASSGAINLLSDPQLRNMGEWKSAITAGDGWMVAFGDGFARGDYYEEMVYRFGKDTGSEQMQNLAIYMLANPREKRFNQPGISGSIFRALETLAYRKDLKQAKLAAIREAEGDYEKVKENIAATFKSKYFEDTEFASLRNSDGWLLGAKGGNNGESHNHNDLGSGALFIKECPVIIDPGVSTYGPRYFEGKENANWNRESYWHNTPNINGCTQCISKDFYATGSRCDIRKNVFYTDIANAYRKNASCVKWGRTWTLGRKDLTITDEFQLSARMDSDVINFVAQGRICLPGEDAEGYRVRNGEVVILAHNFDNTRKLKVRLSFPGSLTPAVTILKLKDPRFTQVWGEKIEKLTLTSAKDAPLSGKYSYKLELL